MEQEADSLNKADADKIMDDAVADFERRIRAIKEAKKAQGLETAVSKYVPSCANNSNLYCLGAYTYSLGAAMNKNGLSPKENGLMQFTAAERETYASDAWGSPQISCPAAANYFETNCNDSLKSCGQSLKDAPNGTTLGDMLAQGYRNGSIPQGSLVLLKSDGNSSTWMHAAMFVGLNENGEPLFSSANPEIIRQPVKEWANQVADPKRSKDTDCYVVNMRSALSAKLFPAGHKVEKEKEQQSEKDSSPELGGKFARVGHDGQKTARFEGKDLGGLLFKVPRDAAEFKEAAKKMSGFLKGAIQKGSNEPKQTGSVGKVGKAEPSLPPNGKLARGGHDGEKTARFVGKNPGEDVLKATVKDLFDAGNLKKAAQKVSDFLGDAAQAVKEKLNKTVNDVKRRVLRNEIRFRAKMRTDKKASKLLKQKSVLGKTREIGKAPEKKAVLKGSGLMKTLMRHSAEKPAPKTSSRLSFNEKMQKVSPVNRVVMAKLGRTH